MRKRAQRKSKPEPEKTYKPNTPSNKIIDKNFLPKKFNNKNWWIAISLISIFLLILLFNTYFNVTSDVAINPDGEGLDKFYLSGPDPYYNMRIVEETYETGTYPFYSEDDPLLNYPIGRSGGRAPLFNMMALGFSRLLTPFMDEIDAIGYSMQFIPALFGALLIFPVYFIGKNIFNKKAGLLAAFFVAVIPTHLSSGHGSAYSLFDHDSFNLLLFFLTFMFLVMSLKEKNKSKSILYAMLGGIPLAGLTMTWVEAQFLYVVIGVYALVQIFIDIFKNRAGLKSVRTPLILMVTGYLISLPVLAVKGGKYSPDIPLFLIIAIAAFGVLYYFFSSKKIPWTISIPTVISIGVIGLVFLYYIELIASYIPYVGRLSKISEILYGGGGIYGNKVSLTIAEANTYAISNSVMSFGPGLYWLGWAGFIFLIYMFYKHHDRKDYLFLLVLFVIDLWLMGIAGRFVNDMVPVIAILGGWVTWVAIDKIDYQEMIKNVKRAGGGLHGIRRGVKFLHIVGILFISFLILLPNAFIAFDAAVPQGAITKNYTSNLKQDYFGEEHSAAFGLGIGKEKYWGHAFDWLSKQDTDIEDPANRPAFISWWDYGFYEVALGDHPTVADNFQDGIPPAANFHTAKSEDEAVAVFIVRLLEGDVFHNSQRELSSNVYEILKNYVDRAEDVRMWIEDPESSPSYGKAIDEEFHEYIREDIDKRHLTVGSQWPENAAYLDIIEILTNDTQGLTSEQLTSLYHDLQDVTGWSIRYYGVEGYDKQIFNIFAFLSDKSLLMLGAPSDEFVEYTFDGYRVDSRGEKIPGSDFQDKPAKEIYDLPEDDRRFYRVTNQDQAYKNTFFNTMFYNTYFGKKFTGEDYDPQYQFRIQVPCVNMKHFYAEYISDISKPGFQYYEGIAAVVIAKYYEGSKIAGNITFLGKPIDDLEAVVTKNLTYYEGLTVPIDHDKSSVINGSFNVLAGADTILQVRRYPELHSSIPWASGSFIVKNVSLDVSDDDAMRKTIDWNRDIGNISIDPGVVNGFVYNSTGEGLLENVTVTFREITTMPTQQGGQPEYNDDTSSNTTDVNGSYITSDLFPGYYEVYAKYNDYFIEGDSLKVESGEKTFNITQPKNGHLEGIVYYDTNSDGKYDSGDEILKNTKVELVHVKPYTDLPSRYGMPETIGNTTTNEEGEYSFESLIPGKINDVNLNTYQLKVETDLYTATQAVYPEENTTTSFNLSVGLTPVNVTGTLECIDTNENIGNVKVDFKPDGLVENNTAEQANIESDENGNYQIDLTPGRYNVSVEEKDGSTLIYSGERKLEVLQGSVSKTGVDIELTKHSVNLSGFTEYNNENIANLTVKFQKDRSIENNSAISMITKSDETGYYTIELSPGYYNVSINTTKQEEGQNYTYQLSEQIQIKEDQISTGDFKNFDAIEKFLKEE